MLVRRDRGDDVRALHGILRRAAANDVETLAGQIRGALTGGRRIDIVEPQARNPEDRLEGQRLEFRLGAVADDRHAAGPLGRQVFGGKRGCGGGAQRGQDRHLRQQHRIAGVDIGEHAEGGDCLQTLPGVLRMAVDIFEAIDLAIAGGHQFDHADRRVRCDARRLVEQVPAFEVFFQIGGEPAQHVLDAHIDHDPHHVIDADEGNDVQASRCGECHGEDRPFSLARLAFRHHDRRQSPYWRNVRLIKMAFNDTNPLDIEQIDSN